MSGTTEASAPGEYTITCTPTKNYCWPDNTFGSKTVTWNITAITISTVPSQSGTLTYTGSAQSPQWSNYNSSQLTLSGDTSKTNAGTYTATFTPKAGYMWSDGTAGAKSVTWSIGRASISTVPTQSNTLTYTGSSQSPAWANYDSNKLTLGGTTSGTNAGSYNATFTPTANYKWSDGSTTAKSQAWSIGKVSGTLSIAPTSLTFDALGSSNAKSIAATSNLPGNATASSSATGIATVSVSGKNVSVTPVADGTATITVGMTANDNYTSPSTQTCSVAVSSLYSGASKDATAQQFQQVIQAGQGPNRFVVGDKITVPLNGTVITDCNLSGNYYAQILGFNHNFSIENNNVDNYVDVQFATTAEGKLVAWASTYFRMTTSRDGFYGTYINSLLGQTFCPAFYDCVDTEWQTTVIAPFKNTMIGTYTDPSSMRSFPDSEVRLLGEIWLLDVRELLGRGPIMRGSTSLMQYTLYANGNSTQRYNIVSPNTTVRTWTRSLSLDTSTSLRGVLISESYEEVTGNTWAALAPAMRIG